MLLAGSDTGHTTLFHPKESSQANQTTSVPAMRYLKCMDRVLEPLNPTHYPHTTHSRSRVRVHAHDCTPHTVVMSQPTAGQSADSEKGNGGREGRP